MSASGLCECGCGRRTALAPYSHARRGMVRGEPMRFVQGHATRGRKFNTSPEYTVDEATGCWVWARSLLPNGYGITHEPLTRRRVSAHRQYYERAHGPIPDGLVIDHLCRNRACVNPAHMEAVTHEENCHRGEGTRLTPADVRAIRVASGQNIELAERYGVSDGMISMIRSGRRWASV